MVVDAATGVLLEMVACFGDREVSRHTLSNLVVDGPVEPDAFDVESVGPLQETEPAAVSPRPLATLAGEVEFTLFEPAGEMYLGYVSQGDDGAMVTAHPMGGPASATWRRNSSRSRADPPPRRRFGPVPAEDATRVYTARPRRFGAAAGGLPCGGRGGIGIGFMRSGRRTAGSTRMVWGVDPELADHGDAVLACGIILDLVRPRIAAASVDACSDYRDELPAEVEAAQERLREIGRRRRRGDPGMDVRLDPADEQDWATLRAYAAWSIETDLFDHDDDLIAVFHDSGASIAVWATSQEAAILAEPLTDVARLLSEEALQIQRRARREARRHRPLRWLRGMISHPNNTACRFRGPVAGPRRWTRGHVMWGGVSLPSRRRSCSSTVRCARRPVWGPRRLSAPPLSGARGRTPAS